ncbi:hypothetical protein KC909_06435, partial [Candidatus Dojkabacteria bacterium]|nr:hypothetical protein [Candidatus Dojkabacteria bacterium]
GIINPSRAIPKKSVIPALKLKRFEDEVTLSWLTREHTDLIEDFSLVNAPKPIWNPNPKGPKAPKPFICLDNRVNLSDKTPFVGMPFINI